MSSKDAGRVAGEPRTPDRLDSLTAAHAKALARYDAVANLRSVAMTVNAATTVALARALQRPDQVGDLLKVIEAADRSMATAMDRWRELDG